MHVHGGRVMSKSLLYGEQLPILRSQFVNEDMFSDSWRLQSVCAGVEKPRGEIIDIQEEEKKYPVCELI